jgi:uncharacterized protein YabE (DUF348 family)
MLTLKQLLDQGYKVKKIRFYNSKSIFVTLDLKGEIKAVWTTANACTRNKISY